MPKVTVLMPVYNANKFLREAVESILKQSFTDFEFLIIDDGSTDDSQSIIRSYDDSRIKFVQNEKNIGVAATLNRGLDLAWTEYIARMDADDISLPSRLEKQIHFMEENPDVGISGTWIRLFGDQLRVVDRCPVSASVVKAYLLFDTAIHHPTAIMRRNLIEKYRLRYDPSFGSCGEDFDFWLRASNNFSVDNLPEALVKMRHHKDSLSNASKEIMTDHTEKLLFEGLKNLGLSPTNEVVKFHHIVGRGRRLSSWDEVERAESWLKTVKNQNDKVRLYESKALEKVIGMVWFKVCSNSTPLGTWVWKKRRESSLSDGYDPLFSEVMRFWASIMWHTVRKISDSR
jgi:glycosyltransferase involved in cell wall biosynthesis